MSAARDRFALGDNPTPAFIAEMRRRFPVEPEVDALFTRKMERRSGPEYHRLSIDDLNRCIERMLTDLGLTGWTVRDQRWFTGGVSKIQLGFTLDWTDADGSPRSERLVVRMDPNEGSNTTSRLREYELLRAFAGTLPVPQAFWLDRDARWFPEPALIYGFAEGVTKPRQTTTGLRHQIALATGIAAAGALGNHAEAMTDLCRRAETLAADPGAGTGAIRDMAMDLAFAVAGVVQTLADQTTEIANLIRQTVLDETARKVELERFWYAPIGFEPSSLDQSRLCDLLQ